MVLDIVSLANYDYLIIVDFLCNKLTLAIFVTCGWWCSRTFIRGNILTVVDYIEWDSFVGAAKPMYDIGIILGESYVLLIKSSVDDSIVLLKWGCISHISFYVWTNLLSVIWIMCI